MPQVVATVPSKTRNTIAQFLHTTHFSSIQRKSMSLMMQMADYVGLRGTTTMITGYAKGGRKKCLGLHTSFECARALNRHSTIAGTCREGFVRAINPARISTQPALHKQNTPPVPKPVACCITHSPFGVGVSSVRQLGDREVAGTNRPCGMNCAKACRMLRGSCGFRHLSVISPQLHPLPPSAMAGERRVRRAGVEMRPTCPDFRIITQPADGLLHDWPGHGAAGSSLNARV